MKTEDYKRLTYNKNDGWKEETVRRLTFDGGEDWKQNKLSEEEIIEQFGHWIEYEKQHKDKIKKADELIEIQQGLLDLYKQEKEKTEILDKMKRRYKIALFMIIRNFKVMPKGMELGKTEKEINKMSYDTMCEVLSMIDFNKAEKIYYSIDKEKNDEKRILCKSNF